MNGKEILHAKLTMLFGKVGIIEETADLVFISCGTPHINLSFMVYNQKTFTLISKITNYAKIGGTDLYYIYARDHLGVLRNDGKIVIPLYHTQVVYDNRTRSFICKHKGKYGILDTEGNVLAQYKYDHIRRILGDYFMVVLNKKCGAITKNDEIILPLECENTSNVLNKLKELGYKP